jgi:hypothetical protein
MQVILIFTSAAAFTFYGILCLLTDHMRAEFIRYGLVRYRTLTGWLEILGGTGQFISFFYPPFMIFSAGGLAALMLMGVIVRVKARDQFWSITPAISLMLINIYLFLSAINKI